MQKQWYLYGLSAVMALAVACGDDTRTPASPSVPTAATANGSTLKVSAAAADGSTLKVSAPAPSSPASGANVDSRAPSLVVNNSTGTFVSAPSLTYRFEVSETSGAVAETVVEPEGAGSGGAGQTMHVVSANANLKATTTYRWRARAESPAGIGPWSVYATFITPASGGGLDSYQNSSELWDNLTDGKSIGTLVNAQLTPKGVYLPTFSSHVTYQLRSTLSSGTIQFLIEGLDSDTNGGKTKIVSMQQGYSDITDNPYRFNVEKRGDDHPDSGKFRIRIITGNAATGFYDSDRLVPSSLSRSKTYHVNVTWGSGVVRLVLREGGNTGPTVLNGGMTYQGTYRPSPLVVHIGAPIPRGGELDATVPGITVRYFYVSQGGTWPGFAPLDQMVGLLTRTGSGN